MHISYKLHPLLDPRPMNGPIKSLSVCLSVCLSVSSAFFSEMAH